MLKLITKCLIGVRRDVKHLTGRVLAHPAFLLLRHIYCFFSEYNITLFFLSEFICMSKRIGAERVITSST